MVCKILRHPIKPIRVAMLTYKKGHSMATSGDEWQEYIFVPKNIDRRRRESIGRHIGIV
jgi:hypothetical protein